MVKGVTSVTWGSRKGLEGLFVGYPGERHLKNPAPEGRPSLAQRFSAGKVEKMIPVPEGRPTSRHTISSDVSRPRAARRIDEMVVLLQFFRARFPVAEYR